MWPYKMVSLKVDNLVVFNYLSAPEIWPDKRLTTVHENLSPLMIYDQYSNQQSLAQ